MTQQAQLALRCLDLTSLNGNDDEAAITQLCQRALTPFGAVAAVCVWPRLAAHARRQLPEHVHVAAVANFPHGATDSQAAVADTRAIVAAGAQEVDVVMPWRTPEMAAPLLQAVREACPGLTLKVILESGELPDAAAIRHASQIALRCGADFLKTSTGKASRHADVPAVQSMLQAIAAEPAFQHVGVKPSGGIRTLSDALPYLDLVHEAWGAKGVSARRFRFGASALLDDLLRVLQGQPSTTGQTHGY